MSSSGRDDFEYSAGGVEDDEEPGMTDSVRSLGEALMDGGPDALLEEIEGLIPDSWKEHIARFPITAVAAGVGLGIFLGMRKGDELISAASAMMSAAATTNLNRVLGGSD